MKLQIHHPRLLILTLLIISSLTTAGVIVANWDKPVLETQAFSIPVPADLEPPTEAEVNDAVAITRDAGWVSAVAGDQEWTLLNTEWGGQPKWISIPGNTQLGIRFTAAWEDPVESDGPWYRTQCQVTRLRKGYTTFSNIHAITVIVDMDQRTPLTRSVAAPFDGSKDSWNPELVGVPPSKNTKTIRNTTSRGVLYEGSYDDMPGQFKGCPPGNEDYKD